jgi:hypothetical protein
MGTSQREDFLCHAACSLPSFYKCPGLPFLVLNFSLFEPSDRHSLLLIYTDHLFSVFATFYLASYKPYHPSSLNMLSYDQTPSSFYNPHRSAIASSVGMPSARNYKQGPRLRHKHIFIVTGPAGCGKSTIAKHLADAHQFPYIEGDEVCRLCKIAIS